ncbi:hypothetical protein [Psychrosphaera haliotis]|uniref:Uncharacterized protein n=1 Tax=Psychrosphaera haliotis TaxID=555083 RepID=A0A6N8FBA5_9GAMM|nr:hypothetical protein [Psychrosphaera haliotis]MUH72799.1 hypothetical protein [Psychrosphaera haliotis]
MSEPIMKITDGSSEAKVYFDQIGISIISGIVTVGITHKQLSNYFANVDQINSGFMTGNRNSERINFILGGAAMSITNEDFEAFKLKHSKFLERSDR